MILDFSERFLPNVFVKKKYVKIEEKKPYTVKTIETNIAFVF